MGLHNEIVGVLMACPHCGRVTLSPIEAWLGRLELRAYGVGERVEWVRLKQVKNGGRPPDGHGDFDGYRTCAACNWDSYVRIQVRDDRIDGVVDDPTRPGHNPGIVSLDIE